MLCLPLQKMRLNRPYQWIHAEKKRYYTAQIVQDLLGEWVVIQRWGGFLSKRGGHKSMVCDSHAAAEVRLAAITRRRQYRHYERVTEGLSEVSEAKEKL